MSRQKIAGHLGWKREKNCAGFRPALDAESKRGKSGNHRGGISRSFIPELLNAATLPDPTQVLEQKGAHSLPAKLGCDRQHDFATFRMCIRIRDTEAGRADNVLRTSNPKRRDQCRLRSRVPARSPPLSVVLPQADEVPAYGFRHRVEPESERIYRFPITLAPLPKIKRPAVPKDCIRMIFP